MSPLLYKADSILLQDKIVTLTSENKDLDTKAHEAQVQQNRAALIRIEWEHEREVLERHALHLNEELNSKSDTLQALRKSTASEVSVLHVTGLSSILCRHLRTQVTTFKFCHQHDPLC